jgi:hypothetical protein
MQERQVLVKARKSGCSMAFERGETVELGRPTQPVPTTDAKRSSRIDTLKTLKAPLNQWVMDF